jgi:hypothetical protein
MDASDTSAEAMVSRPKIIVGPALDRAKLAKVLALSASHHDGEALSAVRAAERMLSAAGLSLAGLVEPVSALASGESAAARTPGALSAALREARCQLAETARRAEAEAAAVAELRRQKTALEAALAYKAREAEGWRDRAWRILWGGAKGA